jgi:hypothetical protein
MSVDRAQLQILIRDLGAIPPAVRRTLRPAVLEASQPILARMRAHASWSSRIPSAISVRPSTTAAGVEFRVSAARAPHARPYESGSLRNPGMVRHPVYGNREVWAQTPIRPFFYRSVAEGADELVDHLGDAVMRAAQQHGF